MENNQTNRNTSGMLPSSERVRAGATEAIDKAKTAAPEQLESGKHIAASQGEKVAAVIDRASSRLKTKLDSLADYTSDLGSRIRTFSQKLEKRGVDDLATDFRDIARRNPKIFLLGGLAVGIGIYKIMKSSVERRHESKFQEDHAANKSHDAERPVSESR